ncbi:carbohydrate ABC transporter permease [Breznakiella homolactica]|uniref:Carbohydrate ABC transporter permease n=1 Tax=Breznakiella homolactica TaxID=2798577 RepID=A0A7T7XNQ9_9SPIR|nr:carbohydrate ABC transporter permease [Breznakiella homolactica]QQO09613.1 carbohydrate ABC transporter permease [Breznakiella homolactica]
MNSQTRLSRKQLIWILVAIFAFFCFCWIYPFLWMVSASFKTTMEIFQKGLNLIPDRIHFENYWRAWVKGGFSGYFMNSVITTVFTILIVVIRCALAGYVLARYNFRGKTIILSVLIATFLIPVGTTIIPTVELSQKMGLLNSRTGLILAMAGGGQVTSILLYKGFFEQLPESLPEAAVIDGAGFFTVFSRIMLPMTGPVTATVTILTFMTAWNNFMIPLVFTFGTPSLRTLPVGMMAFQGANETDWSGMAAAGTMSLIPIVVCFIVLQKYFVSGIAGAVKG